jgi:single-strand DNA-binding protein
MFHTLILTGRLTKDATQRFTPSGKAVTQFSLAVDDGFGENKKTIYFTVSAWENLSETTKNMTKGQPVLVEGRLSHENGNPRMWESNGKHGASFEVNASTVRFLSSREQAETETTGDLEF